MRLALIAGGGDLPGQLARAQAEAPLICAYVGAQVQGLNIDMTFRLETLGTLLVKLAEQGVTQVCFAGGIDRPQLDPSKLDAETAPLVPLFMEALKEGDDGALRVLQSIFETTGFEVVGAHQLVPELVAPPGVLSIKWPDGQMRKDAAKAAGVIEALSYLDVGQACIVGSDQVFAIEAMGGTDHMLSTLPNAAKSYPCILFKGPKSGQSKQIDMPTIGPETLEMAHKMGLTGIVVDAGDVIILSPERCKELADQHGLVLWSRTGD